MNIIQHLDFIIKFFILGAVPWIFLSKEDTLYFKVKGMKLSVIFNCFASLFASSIYICLYYTKSNFWRDDMVFLYFAIPVVILYFILLFIYSEYVEDEMRMDTYFEIKKFQAIPKLTDEQTKKLKMLKCKRNSIKLLVIIHFIIYIAIFSLLAFGLGVNSIIQIRIK